MVSRSQVVPHPRSSKLPARTFRTKGVLSVANLTTRSDPDAASEQALCDQ